MKHPERLPNDWDLRESYKFSCDSCGVQSTFRPSVAMHIGDNKGLVTCPSCNAGLVVHINDDNSAGLSRHLNCFII